MVHHRNSAKTIKLAVVLDSVVKPQVILESGTGMAASAHVFGVPAPHLSTDLEHIRVNTFLDLREKSVCTGITADVLQNFASLPDGTGSKQYFRYIINLPANVMFFHMSCIMSNSWQLLLPTTQDSHNMCSNCSHVEKTHNARYQRQEQKSLQHDTIKSNDPLHSVTGHQMKEVFYDTFLAVIKTIKKPLPGNYIKRFIFNHNCYLAICI